MVFFDKVASEETKRNFEEYVHIHLCHRALPDSVKRYRIFTCSKCGFLVTDQLIKLRKDRALDWVDCPSCGTHISLLDPVDDAITIPSPGVLAMNRAADAKRDQEAAKLTIQGKKKTRDFDVFLCYNSMDRSTVKQIGMQLKKLGILPWFDEWELRPGLPWQRALEEQIEQIRTVAVFIGKGGFGPWQQHEVEAFLREFVDRGCPVIPVVLEEVTQQPQLPVFLKGMTVVDFRQKETKPMEHLIWGITGEHVN